MLSARSQLSFHVPRQHRFEVLEASGARQLGVQRSQISVWLDAVRLCSFDQRVEIGARTCAGRCVTEQPVLAADDKGSNGVLATIVVERHISSIEEHGE